MLLVTLSLISLMPLVYISTELLKYATPVVSETIADLLPLFQGLATCQNVFAIVCWYQFLKVMLLYYCTQCLHEILAFYDAVHIWRWLV